MIKFKIMNEYIDNLNGKDIALKAIEYAKDKNPYMKAFIRQAYIAAYQQAIEDIYGALWHHHTEEPVNERRNESLFLRDISNPFIPRYWISNYTDINWKGSHKFEWAYVDDVMMLMEKMMRLNDCKNEDQ